MDSHVIADWLTQQIGGRWTVQSTHASGFCDTWIARGASRSVFLKSVPAVRAQVLEAEADGLRALAAAGAIRVPEVAAIGACATGKTVLAMEWLDLRNADSEFGKRLGSALGALHRAVPVQGDGRFGWSRDNFLGATVQSNGWSRERGRAGWIEFFCEKRLAPMRQKLAASEPAALLAAIDAVMERMPHLFDDHEPRPSLIHGDLWSGNWSAAAEGTAVIYDPAVSISDAEAELAMMELFGAPPRGFWPAYREVAQLSDGYERRRPLYQLYHLLNHVVLFGGGYTGQAHAAAQAVLS